MIENIIKILAVGVASFLGVWWIYFKVLRMAKEKNLVDAPDNRKLQRTPVPVRGGIAVCFGMLCGVLFASCLFPEMTQVFPIVCAMTVMVLVGSLDDMLSLSPLSRLVIEVLAVLGLCWGSGGCIDSLHGLFGVGAFSWWIGIPLTVFAGVGILNAINMIDGVNGLSSGLCIIYCFCFGIAFFKTGDMANAALGFAMIGAVVVFWLHNVFGGTSKMFIGDAGTMMMGILMTWFVIQILRDDSEMASRAGQGICWVAFCLAILVVPIFDTLRVMTMRVRKGLSPFRPDKTHIHHVFIRYGMAHSLTMVTIVMLDICTILIWYVGIRFFELGILGQFILVCISGILLVWGTYSALRFIERKNKPLMERLKRLKVVRNSPEEKTWFHAIRCWLDAPEFKGNLANQISQNSGNNTSNIEKEK